MELTDLRAFVAIAELGSISAAARAPGQPKSSVSRGLARLEDSVGTMLVDRSSRHLRLTDAGALMRTRAGRVLDEADDVRTALDELAERPRGRLKINAPFTFALGVMSGMLAEFAARSPEIRIVLDIDNKVVNLHAADMDLALRVGALEDSDLVAQKLTTVELWACASRDYLARSGAPEQPGDLAAHTLVSRVENGSGWGFRDSSGKRIVVDVRPALVVPEPVLMQALAIRGVGIARLPDFLAREPIEAGRLVRVLPAFGPDQVDVHALYTSRRALPSRARVFLSALTDHLRAIRVRPSMPWQEPSEC